MSNNLDVNVSIAELLDKISILEIKLNHINDIDKLKKIKFEYDICYECAIKYGVDFKNNYNYEQLKKVNLILWQIEDDIRNKEQNKQFDNEFISIARSVYIINDLRYKKKNIINNFYSKNIICEVKSYNKEDYPLGNNSIDILTKEYIQSLKLKFNYID
jgi:hypothetical protein